jgi:hypothetical protein
MTRSIRLIIATLAALAVAAPLAQAAPQPPDVPGAIAVPEGNKPYLTVHAVGVQIYSCNGTAWSLAGPRADLYEGDKLFGTHTTGPTWQSKDGSAVVGSRAGGINVDPTAVDWLLLSATPTEPGRLGRTTYIQRINTTGGRAPAGVCAAGAGIEVPYTADYVFWKADEEQ